MKYLLINIIFLLTSSLFATSWELLETEYERIFYPASHKKMAIETAYYVEKHRENVLTLTGKKTPYPIYYVLQDLGMTSNGYSHGIDNKIGIFTPAPSLSTFEYFDYNWLETVTIHELFHNYHVHNVNGINNIFKDTIGKFNPHMFLPIMLIEGLAIYQESQLNPYQGRLNTGFFDAILLTKAKENKLPPFTQANNVTNHFPLGQHYMYGCGFINYLASTYSEESLTEFLNSYSYKSGLNPLLLYPKFGIDSIKTPYKKSFSKLYQDYINHLKEKSKKWQLPNTSAITRGQYLSPPISHKNTLYMIRKIVSDTSTYSIRQHYELISIDQKTKKETILKLFNSISGDPLKTPLIRHKNKLFIGFTTEKTGFSNIDNNSFGLTTAIYSYNLKTKAFQKELADTITAFMIDSSNNLIYAKQIPGKHQTEIINHHTNTKIASHPLYITSLSQTSNGIYLTAKHPEGSSNIYQTDQTFQELIPIIATNYIETNPILLDKWLYFSANYNKHFQIYRRHITNNTVEKIIGPSYMTKGTPSKEAITYISLDSNGMTLHQDSLQSEPFTLPKDETIVKPNETDLYKSLNYTIYTGKKVWLKNLQTLTPIIRLPMLTSVNDDIGIGIYFEGYDKLGSTSYSTSILNLLNSETLENKNKWLIYSLDITTTALQPYTINYNHILDTQSVSILSPLYISSITPLKNINLGIETDFKTVMAASNLTYIKNNNEIYLSGNHAFNQEQNYSLKARFNHYYKSSQLSATINRYNKKDVLFNQNNLMKIYNSVTATSLGINYTTKIKSILKSSYRLNTTIEDAYLNVSADYLPYHSKNIISSLELIIELTAGLPLNSVTGISIEASKQPQIYTTIMMGI